MEKLLYQKVFEKGAGMKSANKLGQLANFIAKDIEDEFKYVVNSKTLIRGFRIYIEPEVLFDYQSSRNYACYSPHVDTLRILSIYMGYESFSDFCQKNTVADQEVGLPKTRNTITVYQTGENASSYGDIATQGDLIINPKK